MILITFLPFSDDTNEVGYRVSRENDKIDVKYGFERVTDTIERTGYLINMHSVLYLFEIGLISFIYFLSFFFVISRQKF